MRMTLRAALAATILAPGLALAQPRFEDCSALPEGEFRAAIERGTLAQFTAALPGADAEAVVARQWRAQEMDALIQRLGREARAQVAADAGYVRRLISNYHPGTAEELARAFNQRLYESPEFKARFETLVQAIGADLTTRIAAAGAAAQDEARRCVRGFLGSRYSATVAEAVLVTLRPNLLAPEGPRADLSATTTLNTARALSGAAILVMRGALEGIVERIVARSAGVVAGSLARRLVPVLGTALFAWDLVFGADGVLGEVEEQLAGEESRDAIRTGLAASLRETAGREAATAAATAADEVNRQWGEFRAQYTKVLELAERDPAFRAFLADVPADRFGTLARLVDMLLRNGADAAVAAAREDGTLARAVRLPEPGVTIALARQSLAEALAWADLAGTNLAAVVQYEVFRLASPGQFTAESLARLVGIGQPGPVAALLRLEPAQRATLLAALPLESLRSLAARLPTSTGGEAPLAVLARMLEALPAPEQANALVQALLRKPELVSALASERTREAVLRGSADPMAALEFLARDTALWNLPRMIADVQLALDGQLAPSLLWQKYTTVGAVLVGLLLVLMVLLRRMLAPLLYVVGLLLPRRRAG
jgi:hypothetical protein